MPLIGKAVNWRAVGPLNRGAYLQSGPCQPFDHRERPSCPPHRPRVRNLPPEPVRVATAPSPPLEAAHLAPRSRPKSDYSAIDLRASGVAALQGAQRLQCASMLSLTCDRELRDDRPPIGAGSRLTFYYIMSAHADGTSATPSLSLEAEGSAIAYTVVRQVGTDAADTRWRSLACRALELAPRT